MAAITLGIVPESLRHNHRERHGTLASVLEAAQREHRDGNLHNALAAYNEALGQYLRLAWIDVSGKFRTPITDPVALLDKLRSGGHFDKWMFTTISQALKPPRVVNYRSVDIIAGIVLALCSERVALSVTGEEGVQA